MKERVPLMRLPPLFHPATNHEPASGQPPKSDQELSGRSSRPRLWLYRSLQSNREGVPRDDNRPTTLDELAGNGVMAWGKRLAGGVEYLNPVAQ